VRPNLGLIKSEMILDNSTPAQILVETSSVDQDSKKSGKSSRKSHKSQNENWEDLGKSGVTFSRTNYQQEEKFIDERLIPVITEGFPVMTAFDEKVRTYNADSKGIGNVGLIESTKTEVVTFQKDDEPPIEHQKNMFFQKPRGQGSGLATKSETELRQEIEARLKMEFDGNLESEREAFEVKFKNLESNDQQQLAELESQKTGLVHDKKSLRSELDAQNVILRDLENQLTVAGGLGV
jgi:hypothetical protein